MASSKYVCPHCGANLKKTQSQCSYCGAAVEFETAEPVEVETGVNTEPTFRSKTGSFVSDLKESLAEPVTRQMKGAAIVMAIIMIVIGIAAIVLGVLLNIPEDSWFSGLSTFAKVVPITIGAILIIIGISLIISIARRKN